MPSFAPFAPAIRAICSVCRRTGTSPAPIARAWFGSRGACSGNSGSTSDQVTVRVHDSTADMRYLVLPARPQGTEGWEEDRLAELVSRDCMIGVAVPVSGAEAA